MATSTLSAPAGEGKQPWDVAAYQQSQSSWRTAYALGLLHNGPPLPTYSFPSRQRARQVAAAITQLVPKAKHPLLGIIFLNSNIIVEFGGDTPIDDPDTLPTEICGLPATYLHSGERHWDRNSTQDIATSDSQASTTDILREKVSEISNALSQTDLEDLKHQPFHIHHETSSAKTTLFAVGMQYDIDNTPPPKVPTACKNDKETDSTTTATTTARGPLSYSQMKLELYLLYHPDLQPDTQHDPQSAPQNDANANLPDEISPSVSHDVDGWMSRLLLPAPRFKTVHTVYKIVKPNRGADEQLDQDLQGMMIKEEGSGRVAGVVAYSDGTHVLATCFS
ncbi:hypothetical protein Dda_8541 [Drechslerella dactyloides]|uniref:Uncharacterized protein n=1 Tax=Drechslerella dactyloides TaxID=74499 RepID=A0AAD6NEW5_DREDA|nr:hypothetical protein Dda_8541 [Drechslerella dactyloides]